MVGGGGLGALVLAVCAVVALVVVGLRTGEGRELVTAAGVRVVKVLLGFIERWMGGQLDAVVSSRRPVGEAGEVDEVGYLTVRLAQVRKARRDVGGL